MIRHLLLCFFLICLLSFRYSYAQEDTLKVEDLDFELLLSSFYNDMADVERLLALGANVNATTDDGITPLMYASENGNTAMVELLINRGANVNAAPADGFTALISACLFNHLETAITLIEYGADIDFQNVYGATALMKAAAYGYFIITDMLLFYGAQTELTDTDGNTALIIAATHGFDDIAGRLLEEGANPEAADNNGFTPLMAAAANGHAAVVQKLLSFDAATDKTGPHAYTALSIAVRNTHQPLVETLLEAWASALIPNNYGYSAAEIALINHNPRLYRTIKRRLDKTNYWPYFRALHFNIATMNIGFSDFMLENALGVAESKYNLLFMAGHATRIGHKKVWMPIEENFYEQYNEKRSYIFAGIRQNIDIINNRPNAIYGIDVGLRYLYTYGNLRGTALPVTSEGLWVPSFGVFLNKNYRYGVRLSYEYMDFNTYNLSPHRLTVGINFSIGLRKNPRVFKSVYWAY